MKLIYCIISKISYTSSLISGYKYSNNILKKKLSGDKLICDIVP